MYSGSSTNYYLDHFVDIRLRAGKLGWILHFYQHYEVQVMPHVVLVLDMLLERHGLIVERGSVQS